MSRVEHVPGDQDTYQENNVRKYRCPFCTSPVFSQHAGGELSAIHCLGADGHVLEWA